MPRAAGEEKREREKSNHRKESKGKDRREEQKKAQRHEVNYLKGRGRKKGKTETSKVFLTEFVFKNRGGAGPGAGRLGE